ncbi:MAG: zinc ribbon domain-containing protein [Candidatus Omnitrophota bacterium]
MPIYEYECEGCDLRFECLVRSHNQDIVCPGCGRQKTRRVMSTFAFTSHGKSGQVTASSGGCNGCISHNCSSCNH